MPEELQLKPFEKKEGQKYRVIQITDVSLHTSKHRPTNVVKALEKASENGGSGRIYSSLEKQPGSQKDLVIQLLKMDPEFVKHVKEQEALGFKVLLSIPKEGIPMLAGQDTEEFLKSNKGKRVLRWIDKKNNQE